MNSRKRSKVSNAPRPGSTVTGSQLDEAAKASTRKAVPSTSTSSGKTPGKRKRRAEEDVSFQQHDDFPSSPFPTSLTQSTPAPTVALPKPPPHPHPHPQPQQQLQHGEFDKSSLIAACGPGCAVTTMSVSTSASIETKVSTALRTLSVSAPSLEEKKASPLVVVLLCAKAEAASKMISIVEITKRNIAREGGTWFQYTSVESRLQTRRVPEPASKGGDEVGMPNSNDDDDDNEGKEEEEEGFEVMKTPFERIIEDRPKIRGVPVMAIYLSRVRIDGLRKLHGEQTNAEPPRGT